MLNNIKKKLKRGQTGGQTGKRGHSIPYHHQQSPPPPHPMGGPMGLWSDCIDPITSIQSRQSDPVDPIESILSEMASWPNFKLFRPKLSPNQTKNSHLTGIIRYIASFCDILCSTVFVFFLLCLYFLCLFPSTYLGLFLDKGYHHYVGN